MEAPKRSSGTSQGPHMTKLERQRNNKIASWSLASLKIKDASDFLIHTQMGMPSNIICLRKVFRETDKRDCGANYVFSNAPKMMGALRALAVVLKKDVAQIATAVGGESRWMGIEVTINNTPKIIVSAHFQNKRLPLDQFTATLKESDTLGERFPKHKMPIGLDANAKLASHSDGFRVGNAVPNSDMTAGDEERTTFFVNFMAKNGLVAQNTRTAAAAPQGDMYTRKRMGQTRDTGQSHSWNTGGLDFEIRDSQNQKLQSGGKHIHEHGPQSSFLRNTNEQRRREAHKQNKHQTAETVTNGERKERRSEELEATRAPGKK